MEDNKQTKEQPKEQFVPPPIPSTSWFEAEHHIIGPLDDDTVSIDTYGRMWNFGHKDYTSKKEAIALAVELLKQLAPEKLATKGK